MRDGPRNASPVKEMPTRGEPASKEKPTGLEEPEENRSEAKMSKKPEIKVRLAVHFS